MLKLVFFVPVEFAERVKDAVFAAGAGRQGAYDCAAWETLGTGQFRPLAGSDPFLGGQGTLERVEEMRVETLCDEAVVGAVARALRDAHPYEKPAFEFQRVWAAGELPDGVPDAAPRG